MFSFVAYLIVFVTSQPTDDLITNQPGITWTLNYKQYSGYLDIPNNGHHLHYWFVESMNNPAKDPIVLWLNGGPGCSSFDGLMYEHGPFHVYNTDQQPNVYDNRNNSWNNAASIIYLESPICVGYSYSDDGQCVMNDNTTAADNYQALLQFFIKFPMYATNDFFISGESYAGNYVPVLSYNILQGNQQSGANKINLRGFAVGDPVGFGNDGSNSRHWYNYYHGFIGEALWNNITKSCCSTPYTRQNCPFYNPPTNECSQYLQESSRARRGVNEYDWIVDCYHYPNSTETEIKFDEYERALKIELEQQIEITNNKYLKEYYQEVGDEVTVACINTHGAYMYSNLAAVQAALHVKSNIEWNICSNSLHYSGLSMYHDLSFLYKEMLSMDANLYIMVYNGDVDPGINILGSQWFVDDLNLTKMNNYGWREWFVTTLTNGRQVGGWTKNFQRVSFVTIRGAGHMVPQFKPVAALKMFNAFIHNTPL